MALKPSVFGPPCLPRWSTCSSAARSKLCRLLLVRGETSVAIEIKAGERVHAGDAKHLRNLEEVTGIENRLGLVVYRGRSVEQLGEKIWAVPDVLLFGPQ